MYLGFLPLIFKRCHFKKLSRRTLSPFVRSALLFCALICTFFWLSPAVVAAESSRIELTAEEQAWLAEHPVITLATGNGNYPPAEIKNPDGTWSGFNIEFFEQLSKLLDIDIRLHYGAWAETQKKAMNGELDGLSIVGKDPRRDVIFNATETIY